MTTMRSLFVLTALAAFVALAPVPAGAQSFTVTIKNHRFQPAEIKVPAGKRITVTVVNDDPTPEEFESHELKFEKVIPGKSKGDRALRAADQGPLSSSSANTTRTPPRARWWWNNRHARRAHHRLSRSHRGRPDRRHRAGGDARRVGRGRWVTTGVVGGVLGAAVVALFAGAISEAFEGAGQELFNASVLGIAVVMLMWHNAWMARHGREIAAEMRSVGTAVSEGARPLTALAIVVGLAVLREGSEVVLFLYGIMASGTSGMSLLTGGLLGVAAGAAVHRAHLFRAAGDPDALHLLGDQLADRAARRRHGGAGGAVPQQWRPAAGARPHHVGHVLAAVGGQHLRQADAHADRLYRAADRIAARRLYRHAVRDVPADALRALSRPPRAAAASRSAVSPRRVSAVFRPTRRRRRPAPGRSA